MVILADNVHKKESTFITIMITSHTQPSLQVSVAVNDMLSWHIIHTTYKYA